MKKIQNNEHRFDDQATNENGTLRSFVWANDSLYHELAAFIPENVSLDISQPLVIEAQEHQADADSTVIIKQGYQNLTASISISSKMREEYPSRKRMFNRLLPQTQGRRFDTWKPKDRNFRSYGIRYAQKFAQPMLTISKKQYDDANDPTIVIDGKKEQLTEPALSAHKTLTIGGKAYFRAYVEDIEDRDLQTEIRKSLSRITKKDLKAQTGLPRFDNQATNEDGTLRSFVWANDSLYYELAKMIPEHVRLDTSQPLVLEAQEHQTDADATVVIKQGHEHLTALIDISSKERNDHPSRKRMYNRLLPQTQGPRFDRWNPKNSNIKPSCIDYAQKFDQPMLTISKKQYDDANDPTIMIDDKKEKLTGADLGTHKNGVVGGNAYFRAYVEDIEDPDLQAEVRKSILLITKKTLKAQAGLPRFDNQATNENGTLRSFVWSNDSLYYELAAMNSKNVTLDISQPLVIEAQEHQADADATVIIKQGHQSITASIGISSKEREEHPSCQRMFNRLLPQTQGRRIERWNPKNRQLKPYCLDYALKFDQPMLTISKKQYDDANDPTIVIDGKKVKLTESALNTHTAAVRGGNAYLRAYVEDIEDPDLQAEVRKSILLITKKESKAQAGLPPSVPSTKRKDDANETQNHTGKRSRTGLTHQQSAGHRPLAPYKVPDSSIQGFIGNQDHSSGPMKCIVIHDSARLGGHGFRESAVSAMSSVIPPQNRPPYADPYLNAPEQDLPIQIFAIGPSDRAGVAYEALVQDMLPTASGCQSSPQFPSPFQADQAYGLNPFLPIWPAETSFGGRQASDVPHLLTSQREPIFDTPGLVHWNALAYPIPGDPPGSASARSKPARAQSDTEQNAAAAATVLQRAGLPGTRGTRIRGRERA